MHKLNDRHYKFILALDQETVCCLFQLCASQILDQDLLALNCLWSSKCTSMLMGIYLGCNR